MRLAFLSDMHGNLPAFEAVLAEIERRGPFDAILGGGDYVVGGLNPAECIQILIDRGWDCVRGNAEEVLVDLATDGAVPVQNAPPDLMSNESVRSRLRWTADRVNSEQIEFLQTLPLMRAFTGPSGQSLALVHATPWSAHPIVWSDAPVDAKRELLERAGTDALIYAHIHHAYQEVIDGKTICCMGSVGIPFDGDVRPCFAIVTDEGDGWSFEHVRVGYDYEAYARALESSDMPGAADGARQIRTAEL